MHMRRDLQRVPGKWRLLKERCLDLSSYPKINVTFQLSFPTDFEVPQCMQDLGGKLLTPGSHENCPFHPPSHHANKFSAA